MRDQHFSSVIKYVVRTSNFKVISTASELKLALELGANAVAKEYFEDDPIHVHVYLLNLRPSGTYQKETMSIEHIEAHYCIQRTPSGVFAAYLSDASYETHTIYHRITAGELRLKNFEDTSSTKKMSNDLLRAAFFDDTVATLSDIDEEEAD